jgi:CubicO group peptidase (beta-lactamase class C family)
VEFSKTRQLLGSAVSTGVTPAAVIEVGRRRAPLWSEAFGRLSYDPEAAEASVETIFDLASLTKVVGTTSLVIREARAGRLTLDTRVADLLEGWAGERSDIRLRHLLDHSSGLPGHVRMWERAQGRREYAAALQAVPLERRPGDESVYSDLGFIALGFALEAVTGTALDRQFEDLQRAWNGRMAYVPSANLLDRIAPTEVDPGLGRAIQGVVHDENSRALGGIAGHAGLFGSAADVGAFARLVLASFHDETPLATPELMRVFSTPTGVPGSSRALGWDTMRPTSSCGERLSPAAIGHTGFTGTSLWIDPEQDLYVVLLTNRIHPTRTNEALLQLRPRIHDLVVDEAS